MFSVSIYGCRVPVPGVQSILEGCSLAVVMVTRLQQLILKMISFPVAEPTTLLQTETQANVGVICLWHGSQIYIHKKNKNRVGDGMLMPHLIAMVMVVC